MKIILDIAPHEDGVHCDVTCHLAMIIPIQNNHVLIRIQCPFLPPRYATASDNIIALPVFGTEASL